MIPQGEQTPRPNRAGVCCFLINLFLIKEKPKYGKRIAFSLFHGYVDRWLVSGVTETPVITKPTALHGAENEN